MRRLLIACLTTLAVTVPAVAAEPPGPTAVVEALDQACRLYVRNDDYEGYRAKAGELGITDFFGTLVRRAPGVDIFAISATADAPFTRQCTIAVDGPPALAEGTPAAVATWAKANGFKTNGAPKALTNSDRRPYTATFWTAPKAQLQINTFGPGANGRANVAVIWSVAN
jgi:hypothetical protein